MRWKCHLTSNLHVLHWQTAFFLCAKLPHSFHYFVMSVIFSDFVSYWQCGSCKAYVVESTRVLCLFVCNINFPVCRMTSDGGSRWERENEKFSQSCKYAGISDYSRPLVPNRQKSKPLRQDTCRYTTKQFQFDFIVYKLLSIWSFCVAVCAIVRVQHSYPRSFGHIMRKHRFYVNVSFLSSDHQ